jgi:cell division septal protein FtsQ
MVRNQKSLKQETRTVPSRGSSTTRAVRPARSARLTWLRRVNWRLIAVAVALTAGVSGIVAGITLGPFRITAEDVTVTGTKRIEAWEVVRAANVEDANIFTIRPEEIEARVEAVEGVSDARVRARLPNHLQVEVREFLPLVAWQTAAGARWIAEDGALVPASGIAPVLTLTDPQGEAADREGKLRKKVLENLTAIQQVRPDLNQLYYGKREGIYFRLPEGYTVYLGEEGEMKRKLALMEGMRQRLAQGDVTARTIDLRLEQFPTLK